MAYNSTTWSPDTLAKASETSSATLNNATLSGTLTVGVDDTGHDVKFFGATSGQYLLWDESADELVLAGDSKLSFHDAAGGENIVASSDGHLEINAGTTLDITAPTIDINASTSVNIDGASQFNNTLTVGANTTGYDVKLFGASNNHYMLWNAGSDDLVLSDNAQIKVGTGSDGSFYHNGTHTYLANSTGSLFVTTTTGSLNLGTITSGIAVSIGHTTSETTVNDNLTVTGTTTLNSTLDIGSDGTGHDVKLFGATSGRYLLWDASDDDLILVGANVALDASGDLLIAGDLSILGNNIQGSAGGTAITFNDNDIEFADNVTLKSDESNLYFGASSEVKIVHRADNGLDIEAKTGVTNTPRYPLQLVHSIVGTPSAGIGTGLSFRTETGSSVYHTGGHFETVTTDITDGGEDFDFVWKLMESGNDAAERMRLTSAGNLSISGDLILTGGDIDLSGEISTITLKDDITNALIIGSADATTTFTMHTNDLAEHIQINTTRTSSGGSGISPITASLDIASTIVLTGNINDSNSGGISFDPVISGGHTVTRYNYLKFENPSLVLSAALTDACIMQFDANAGTHKAVDSGSAHPDIDTTDAWIKININGTVHYIPAYTDKS